MPMKKLLLPVILVLSVFEAGAQVYLTDAFKPEDSKKFEAITSKGNSFMSLAVYPYKGGFTLRPGEGGLIADHVAGYAVFKIGGAYEKLSFVVGPGGKSPYSDTSLGGGEPNSASDDSNVIFTVRGNGRILADEVVRCHDTPKEYVVDVTGVDELRFELPRGDQNLCFGEVRLWKAGQSVKPAANPVSYPSGKVVLGKQLKPYFIKHSGWVALVTDDDKWSRSQKVPSISINRVEFKNGLQFTANQALAGNNTAWAYFWLQRKYDKLSFIIGPRDNQSSNATGWITVKGDGKILYERLVKQDELAEQVVLNIRGVNQLSFESIDQSSDFLGGLTFGLVDITAYPSGDTSVPSAGVANLSKGRLSNLADATPLASTIKPFSVRGVGSYNSTYFAGESTHYTFSMGGEKFYEGFILTTGTTLFDDNISSFAAFDLAGEFDYVTFTSGTLTNHRVLDEDRLLVYADDRLILDTKVHCTWPNQVFTLPLEKCRVLKFAKPGTGKGKQTYIGVGDIMVFRGQPQDASKFFYHRKPECPDVVDLIDLCERPYFHYVGRFLSSTTNFDFNDCFKNGESQKEFFQMKDGSKIYKGVMLETNIPPALAFEDITLSEAVFMFLMGAGSAISASNVAAYTGVSAGAGLAGAMAAGWSSLSLVGDSNHQSSVAAFNPYGEYETLTFTVANRYEYYDKDLFGATISEENPVKLNVFADMRKVGEYWLNNKMQPTTYTVPINKCTQLMFWLECGDSRSGQYILYDMTLSKEKCDIPIPDFSQPSQASSQAPLQLEPQEETTVSYEVTSAAPTKSTTKTKAKKTKKEADPIVWDLDRKSFNPAVDDFLKDVTNVWKDTERLRNNLALDYSINQTWVKAANGAIFKIITFPDKNGNRVSTTDIQKAIVSVVEGGTAIQNNAKLALVGLPGATVGLMNIPKVDDMTYFGKYVKGAKAALDQCSKEAKSIVEMKNDELDLIQSYIKKSVNVGPYKSTARVIILQQEAGDVVPATMQSLESFNF